ncbi:thermonuclease family protein [Sulfurimonas sp. SAG-AH-194-I05]|nr:thermonuclease family protein [Sulfurimonas sp. SAG-AH-194-I05]MDF1874546.1 thermonuclease family protein [Sulfurimonas sp. SAG-AH-194-I05]
MKIFFKILFLLLLSLNTAHTVEPQMAILYNIITNDMQEYKIGNTKFVCSPYGVMSIDEMYRISKPDSTCAKSIIKFYEKRRDLQYYIYSKIRVQQQYPIVYKNGRCIVNIEGERSLSEILLAEGLALRQPLFKDKEYFSYFYNAQNKARTEKKGLWGENINRDCVASIYRKE